MAARSPGLPGSARSQQCPLCGSSSGWGAGGSCPRGLPGPVQGVALAGPVLVGQFQALILSQPSFLGPLALTQGWSMLSPPRFCAVLKMACSRQKTPVGYSEPSRSRVHLLPHCHLPSLTDTKISRTCGLRLHLHQPVFWGPGDSFSLRFAIHVHKLLSLICFGFFCFVFW